MARLCRRRERLCIGFRNKYLHELNKLPFVKFNKVIYNKALQEKFVSKTVHSILNRMTKEGIGIGALGIENDYSFNVQCIKTQVLKMNVNGEFFSSRYPLPTRSIPCNNFTFSTTKLRTSQNKIISYSEMNFSKIKCEFVKEVWIGPKSQVSKADVLKLLASSQYYSGEFNSNKPIKIEHSESSYR